MLLQPIQEYNYKKCCSTSNDVHVFEHTDASDGKCDVNVVILKKI